MKKMVAATTFGLALILAFLNVTAQTQSRKEVINQIETKRAELSEPEKKIIAVSDSDRGQMTFVHQ